MSIETLVPAILVLLFVLIFLGTHLGLAMTGAAVLGTIMLIGFDPAMALAGLSIYETALSFDLSVIPLFVLMGTFASKSRISADLYDAFNHWLRKRQGGLAYATIAACGAFGAVCGSSLATAATMGKVALPQMDKYGYHPRLSTGAVAAGGTIGILIPPSVIMVIYGILTETNIGDLFIAGIAPGLLLVVSFMVTVKLLVVRNSALAPLGESVGIDISGDSPFSKVWSTLVLFVIVIGGIYGGIFTPTEAAGIGAIGALVIGVVMRRLNRALIYESFMETLETTAMIFLILIGAILFSSFLTLTSTPSMIGSWIEAMNLSPMWTLILILLIYILMGALLDTMAMIILTIPIFFPIILSMGFDQVWFGIVVVIVVELALITPPMGINVFVIRGLTNSTPLVTIFRGVLPFCISLLFVLMMVVIFPGLATFAI